MTPSRTVVAFAAALACSAGLAPTARAQEPIIGQLAQFGTNWCPEGWLRANGDLLPISQYAPLFSLIGTTYGGNGTVTFALPDLRARSAVSYSNQLPIGAAVGQAQVTLLQTNLPAHSHGLQGDETGPVGNDPAGAMLGTFPVSTPIYSAGPGAVPMNVRMLQTTGGNQPVNVQSPALATNWCIATEGLYPSRP